MGKLQYNSGDLNPVPPAPRTSEQTAEWYMRERELEARYFGKLVGLLVYLADVLVADGVGSEDEQGDEFLAARKEEWRALYDALPVEAQQATKATCHSLGCDGWF